MASQNMACPFIPEWIKTSWGFQVKLFWLFLPFLGGEILKEHLEILNPFSWRWSMIEGYIGSETSQNPPFPHQTHCFWFLSHRHWETPQRSPDHYVHSPHSLVALTSTDGWWSWPLAAGLADPGGGPLALIPSITVVFTGGTIVVPHWGAGEVAMQWWFQSWAASHCQGEVPVRGYGNSCREQ